jgi:WD40 repeat protein
LKEIQTENVGKWSNDTSRFLKLHWNHIRENPLRVYYAFAFCPRSSIFHQVYSKMESFPHPVVTIGLDEDWPSSIIVQTYHVSTHCLSPSEDILITGGKREGLAVYSVWDIKTADGESFVHPCKTDNCRVRLISFDQSRGNVELRTGCACGTFCRWYISSDSHSLLEQIRIGSTGYYWWWANDGSKAVCVIKVDENSEMQGDDEPSLLYRLSISGTPPVFHILLKAMREVSWLFSPGHGDKVVGADNERFTLWECSSGRLIFQKPHAIKKFPRVCFSPDGTIIAYVCGGVAELISAEDGTVLRSWNGIEHVESIQFFPTGDRFIGRRDGAVYLFDGDVLHRKKIYCKSIFVSPDSQRVALISYDGVDIFNHALDGKLEHHDFSVSYGYNRHFSWIHSILISVDDATISFDHFSQNIQLSLSTRNLSRINTLLISPDNHHLLTLHTGSSIDIWDVKSDQRLYPSCNRIPNLSYPVRMEFAPDSSCALVWDQNQLMVLQYSTGRIEWVPIVPLSSSEILVGTFFQDSIRILIIEADGGATTVSLRDASRYSMPRLRSRLNKIRQLVISPMEELLAICSNSGLIIHGTCQDIDRAPLLPNNVQSAVFSPEGTWLYTVEPTYRLLHSNIMVSRVDTQNWTVQRIFPIYNSRSRITLSIYNWGSIELETMKADRLSALRVSYDDFPNHRDIFFSFSTGRQIIPPSSWLSGHQLRYRDRWLMTLPTVSLHNTVMNRNHLAYINEGKAFVLDHSSLIKQM